MPEPESIFRVLTKDERANIKQAKLIYSKRIRLYKEGCNLLHNLIMDVCAESNKEKVGSLQDIAMTALGSRIIGTSKVIYELAIRGYQFDVEILVRSLVETSLVLWYIHRSVDNTEKWLSGKIHFSDIKKDLFSSPDEVVKSFYDRQSHFVHSNIGAILSLIENQKEDNVIVCKIEPWGLADEHNFLGNFWALPLMILFDHYKNIIRPETNTRIEKLIAKVKNL